ncbi:type III restriction enzyme, res subunit domain-containing protein [Hirsutella rhossiliensis]|uniref:Type III restriction enzyme, res subunit domain-containing protein n=1 Tax=Hirsutella rhossiliensis TaxID=111463 RepID=A0A9P8SC74_9HYPO|nr:type III restriction enzyme, res subunit domain-containing protein [Hirsutella rhossiliensis]KAH0957333.1 type III restriction enzyme, res subunit domain-containing protein [Hirsutella rhossiliensis]
MAYGSSSPLPSPRHLSSVPRTPSSRARASIPARDGDELAGDTIPCSPTAFWRGPDSTQPTQILSRPTLHYPPEPSSPATVVEVPASSPFQRKEAPRLGLRLAPAGTVFRPPVAAMAPKRPPTEPINLISDDEDGLAPSRADIRPTTFKAQMAAFAYNPATEERETKKKLRQVYDALGGTYPPEQVRKALKACDNDLDDAITWLEREPPSQGRRAQQQQPPAEPRGRRLVSKGTLKRSANNSSSLPPEPPATAISGPPKQPRRRLVQGLRNRSDSSSQREDAYQAENSPEPKENDDDRALACINTSRLQELAAMTGMKENLLEPLIARRPFSDLAQARRVTSDKKPGSRKAAKISIGDSVVDAVQVFLNAVSAIDNVVAQCELKARTVKSVVDTWDIDSFGHDKRSGRATPDKDMPPTPTSIVSSRYTRPLVPQQPTLMDGHCEMKPFQLFGLNWMSLLYNYDIGCILADEMGLGKTCQVISFICHLVEEHERQGRGKRPWPNLIVVPPSTYNNWLIEFERFAPDLSVIGYRGTQSERAEIAWEIDQEPDAYHVVLATYSQINSDQDVEAMQALRLNAAIYDEGHKMKNPETKLYKDLRQIPATWKMLLTGTPVQNNLLEMTSLLSFINPRIDVSNGAFLYNERVKRARTILEPFILQRRKDQVLSDMPRKISTVVHCDMSETQRPVYDEYEETFRLEPSQRVGRTVGRQNDQNNVWMQLRKAALHPLLFRRQFTDKKVEAMGRILMDKVPQSELHQPDLKHLIQELKNASDFELHLWCRDYPRLLKQFDIPPSAELDSGKVKKLLQLIGQYQKNGDRVLVFSKFSRLIELLREVLARQDIEHRVLMGNTNVSERQTLIDEFNGNPEIPVFLLTTGAGGTGINLTAANKVIIFDQSDNPQDDIQAENRAHRLGQQREVEVVRLISSHTVEELLYKACQKKIELANKVTGAVEEPEAEVNMEREVRKLMEQEMTPP